MTNISNHTFDEDVYKRQTLTDEGFLCRRRAQDIVAMAEKARQEITPVSYTHLDVYKRQGLWW